MAESLSRDKTVSDETIIFNSIGSLSSYESLSQETIKDQGENDEQIANSINSTSSDESVVSEQSIETPSISSTSLNSEEGLDIDEILAKEPASVSASSSDSYGIDFNQMNEADIEESTSSDSSDSISITREISPVIYRVKPKPDRRRRRWRPSKYCSSSSSEEFQEESFPTNNSHFYRGAFMSIIYHLILFIFASAIFEFH